MCPDASVSLGLQLSAVAGRNVFYLFFFLGGGGNLAERKLGAPRRKPLKFFEIYIPEIAANASNFKN